MAEGHFPLDRRPQRTLAGCGGLITGRASQDHPSTRAGPFHFFPWLVAILSRRIRWLPSAGLSPWPRRTLLFDGPSYFSLFWFKYFPSFVPLCFHLQRSLPLTPSLVAISTTWSWWPPYQLINGLDLQSCTPSSWLCSLSLSYILFFWSNDLDIIWVQSSRQEAV